VELTTGTGSINTNTVTAVNGLATFSDLAITGTAGAGRVLSFTASGYDGQLGSLSTPAIHLLTVPETPSAGPSILTGVGRNGVRISLSKPADDGDAAITSFRVWKRIEPSGIWMSAGSDVLAESITETNFTCTGLAYETTYGFRYEALNEVGASPASPPSTESYTTLSAPPTAAPTASPTPPPPKLDEITTTVWLSGGSGVELANFNGEVSVISQSNIMCLALPLIHDPNPNPNVDWRSKRASGGRLFPVSEGILNLKMSLF